MKSKIFHSAMLLCLALGWLACGAGHPTISSITVSPQAATSTVAPRVDVQYTATANFTNNTSRELTFADGLTWTASNPGMATVSDAGSATCLAPGQVTITATAPADLNITVNNGVNNTSPKVSGSATLTCQ